MRAIRVGVVCSAGASAVALLCVCLGAAENQPSAAKAPDLQQRVATLEEKVAQLEKKLNRVAIPPNYPLTVPPSVAPPATPTPQGTPRLPALPQVPPGVPPNAVPREFNGQTYYIVPLTKEAAR